MRRIITEIQSLGIRVPDEITGRKSGAGPAEGRAFLIGGFCVNAPIAAPYVRLSPYFLEEQSGRLILMKNAEPVCPVEVVPEPAYYARQDENGTALKKVALLHGRDCLATTVLQDCVRWKLGQPCSFCGTRLSIRSGASLAVKTPEQLAATAKIASETDPIRHVVLTSGTADPPGHEIQYLADCVRAIRRTVDLPVHVQFAPPPDLSVLKNLKRAGTDTVGIHAESFDPETLRKVAPAKAAIGMNRYEAAWKTAVEIFGANQVSSFIITGIGEPPESVVSGAEILADMGVYPFVVPLRPIPGSQMADHLPPSPDVMDAIYTSVAGILRRKGLHSKNSMAGCVRCGACSALPAYESPCNSVLVHRARNPRERDAAFAVRKEVFVREQGLFSESDGDAQDEAAIHLVGKVEGRVVGTVRVFPGPERNGHWVGGRLAVKKDHRTGKLGWLLVKEAMKRVKKRGCTTFTAHIQTENVNFFKRLGWTPVGPVVDLFERPHQKMQADLSKVPEDF